MIERKELRPGSPEPSSPPEVDLLLTFVPELSFLPALEGNVPHLVPGAATHEAVDAHFQPAVVREIVSGLRNLGELAAAEDNGGIAFLVRTMLHFLETQPVPASQHPLLVALYLRGVARASGEPESPRAVASAMDRWR